MSSFHDDPGPLGVIGLVLIMITGCTILVLIWSVILTIVSVAVPIAIVVWLFQKLFM